MKNTNKYRGKFILSILLLTVSFSASAVDYYLKTLNLANAQIASSWNTDPLGTGLGTNASNFTTSGDRFIIRSATNGTIAFNNSLTIGSGVTLRFENTSTLTIGAGGNNHTTSLTINGTIEFAGTSANQLILPTGGNPKTSTTFTLSDGANFITVNANGVGGTNASVSLAANSGRAFVNYSTNANYTFNGAAQATSGMPATVNDLTFLGSNTKTLTGNTEVSAALIVAAGVTLANGGFSLNSPTSTTLSGGATIGSTISGTGVFTLGGNVTVNDATTGTAGATISCPIALTDASSRIFTVADGSGATDLTISGLISTTGSITKEGAGTMVLSNASNSYSGGTNINAGTLSVAADGHLGNTAADLTLNGGTLAVTTGFTMNTSRDIAIGSSGGTINIAASQTLSYAGTVTGGNNLTKSGTGTLTFGAGNVTVNNLTVSTGTLNAATSTIFIAGDFTNSGTFNHNSGTVNFNGSGSQSVGAATFFNLQTSTGGTKTLSGTITVNSILTIGASTTLNGSTHTINLPASGTPLVITGTFTPSTSTVNYNGTAQNITAATYNNLSLSNANTKTALGTLTVGGNLTIASGVTLATGNNALSLGGNFTNAGTFFNAGSSQITITGGTTQSIAGFTTTGNVVLNKSGNVATLTGNVTATGLVFTAGTINLGTGLNHTFSGQFTGAGGTLQGGSSVLNLTNATPVAVAITFTPQTSTVNFAGTAQSIPGTSYYNASFTNSGTKTAAGAIVVTNTLTVASGVILNMGSNQLSGFSSGTGNEGTIRTARSSSALPSGITWGGTVEYYGSGPDVIGGTYAAFLYTASGVSVLTSDITVQTALTLSSGSIETDIYTFTIETTNITVSSGSLDVFDGSVVFNVNGTINLVASNPLFGGQPIKNLTLNGGVILNLATDQEISGSLTITSGKLGMAPSKVLIIAGSVSMDSTNCLKGDKLANLTLLHPYPGSVTIYFDQTGPFTNYVNDLTLGRIGNPADIAVAVTVGNTLKVRGNLTPLKGSVNAGGNLTIASDAAGSGRILQITPTNFTFNGNVVVERYVKDKNSRRYIFIASPVAGQTVREAWQDDIFITAPGTGGTPCAAGTGNGGVNDKYNNNGMDATIYNAVTMYSYDQYLPTRWVEILNSNTAVERGKGYRVLFRGPRGLNDANCSTYLQTNTPPSPSEAILNVSGPVSGDSLNVTVSGSTSTTAPIPMGYTLLGNPYACELDFTIFQGQNNSVIPPKYWTFDPNGPDGNITTYLTYSLGDVTGGYHSGSDPDDYNGDLIASGQAFFVEKTGAGDATVTFRENQKTGQPQAGLFRTSSLNKNSRIRVNFFKANNAFIDNIIIRFSNDPTVTTAESPVWDASTFNGGNFIAGLKGTRSLAIQTRPINFTNDTVGLRIVSSSQGSCKLTFTEFANFTEAAEIILLDMFLGTQTNVRTTPFYDFEITSSSASQGGNRFKLVFRSLSSVMPLSFLNITAIKKEQGVDVSWRLAFEQDVIKYIVERSENGRDFMAIGEVVSKGNSTASVDYNYLDTRTTNNTVYYRIKSIEASASKFSAIVKLNGSFSKSPFTLYPNPAKDNLSIISSNNDLMGGAIAVVRNMEGKTVLQQSLSGGNGIKNLDVSKLAQGIYFLSITSRDGKVYLEKFIKQ